MFANRYFLEIFAAHFSQSGISMNSLSPMSRSLMGRQNRLAAGSLLPPTASSHTPRLFSQACRGARDSQRTQSGRSCISASGPVNKIEVRSYSSTPTKSIKDPEHPTGLWYHSLPGATSGATRYAVSYLSQSPSSEHSKDVIATFDAPSSQSADPAAFARQNPDRVTANKAFWTLLHEALKEDVVAGEKDAILVQEADLREDGWAHLADQRQLLMPGRIPTPDAIIASVSFANCKISPETYEINGTHRPITKEEGWTVLRDVWLDALKARLKRS
ncbi:unnamed protein product [Sympodiomycopsis kandeliae]